MNHRSYDDALAALRRALVFGINPSLDGIEVLAEALGRPQDTFRVVQVAGTNGKGSTARYVAALLRGHGIRVGLYTSPELERVNERIEVDGAQLSDEEFALAVSAALDAAERLRPGTLGERAGFTEFELLTAAALWTFRERGVELAVLEVGMGGRWDATSVASPQVAVVTGVGLDHTAILGETRELIAGEKAAIIVPGCVPVLGPGTHGVEQVFLKVASQAGTQARAVREEEVPSPVEEERTVRFEATGVSAGGLVRTRVTVRGLHATYPQVELEAPAYQAPNFATALSAAEAVLAHALDPAAVALAATLRIPGRFEFVSQHPPIVLDAAHNPPAAAVLAQAIDEAWPDTEHLPLVVLGVLADKDAYGIVEALAPVASGFVVTQPVSPRALPAHELAAIVTQDTRTEPRVEPDLSAAIAWAAREGDRGVVVTGSITTAGQARTLLLTAE